MKLTEITDDAQQDKHEYWDSFYNGVLYNIEDILGVEFDIVPQQVKELIASLFNEQQYPDINETAEKVAEIIKSGK